VVLPTVWGGTGRPGVGATCPEEVETSLGLCVGGQFVLSLKKRVGFSQKNLTKCQEIERNSRYVIQRFYTRRFHVEKWGSKQTLQSSILRGKYLEGRFNTEAFTEARKIASLVERIQGLNKRVTKHKILEEKQELKERTQEI